MICFNETDRFINYFLHDPHGRQNADWVVQTYARRKVIFSSWKGQIVKANCGTIYAVRRKRVFTLKLQLYPWPYIYFSLFLDIAVYYNLHYFILDRHGPTRRLQYCEKTAWCLPVFRICYSSTLKLKFHFLTNEQCFDLERPISFISLLIYNWELLGFVWFTGFFLMKVVKRLFCFDEHIDLNVPKGSLFCFSSFDNERKSNEKQYRCSLGWRCHIHNSKQWIIEISLPMEFAPTLFEFAPRSRV